MPFVRLRVNCGWCNKDAVLTAGNPELATTVKDTPFDLMTVVCYLSVPTVGLRTSFPLITMQAQCLS